MACSAPKTSSGCNPDGRPLAHSLRRLPHLLRGGHHDLSDHDQPQRGDRRHRAGLLCAATAERLRAERADPDRHLCDRRPRPQHPGRLYRADFDRPRRVLSVRRLHLGLHLQHFADPGVLRHSAGGRRDGTGRADLRRAGGAAEGALSRHRDAGGAIHPARFLLARRLVLRRLGAGQRQSVLDLRLCVARRPAIFLRGAGLSRWSAICWSPI